ncbi:hypothetical protein HDU98_008948 [Podochytrium sp. JEL0797]|nr:hypothetical protein HDU98_008948 [Podochytrium sp. JEL0797]
MTMTAELDAETFLSTGKAEFHPVVTPPAMQDKNDDLSLPALQRFDKLVFVPSPTPGVWRGPLDRKGNEVARATTLVRFDPNKKFPFHVHSGGEEFLVLEGTFIDDEGEYPSGSYIRHPVGSSHEPWVGADGCLILVKLHWMPKEDPLVVIRDASVIPDGSEKILFESAVSPERVSIVSLAPGGVLDAAESNGGLEVFVMEGEVEFEGNEIAKYGWIRQPAGFDATATVIKSSNGAKLFVKRNHLAKF